MDVQRVGKLECQSEHQQVAWSPPCCRQRSARRCMSSVPGGGCRSPGPWSAGCPAATQHSTWSSISAGRSTELCVSHQHPSSISIAGDYQHAGAGGQQRKVRRMTSSTQHAQQPQAGRMAINVTHRLLGAAVPQVALGGPGLGARHTVVARLVAPLQVSREEGRSVAVPCCPRASIYPQTACPTWKASQQARVGSSTDAWRGALTSECEEIRAGQPCRNMPHGY